MIHTVDLFCKISSSEYYYLNSALMELSKKNRTKFFPNNHDGKKERFVYNCFKDRGINLVLKKKKLVDDIVYYEIEILLTPKRLLLDKEFIEVISEDDLPIVKKRFKETMKELKKIYNSGYCKYKPKFIFDNLEQYNVRRIDYCVNIYSNHCGKMLDLIRRGDIPNNFKPFLEYNEKSKRKIMPKESFYLISKSVKINIYSKFDQMSKDKYYDNINISKAKGILRFEIQCCSIKVNNLKHIYQFERKTFFDFAKKEIARKVLVYYLGIIIGSEDYYTLNKARIMVKENTEIAEKAKKEIIAVLELINTKRSIPAAREKYVYGDKKFDKNINKIRKLGVNPITIPLNWEIEYLENPIQEIKRLLE